MAIVQMKGFSNINSKVAARSYAPSLTQPTLTSDDNPARLSIFIPREYKLQGPFDCSESIRLWADPITGLSIIVS